MWAVRYYLFMVVLFAPGYITAQDYAAYQRIFNRVDNDIITDDLEAALERTDTVYSNYNFIYAVHCVKTLQMASASNDSLRANKWLRRAILQGVPLWMLRQNKLTARALTYSNCQSTLSGYDSLRLIYYAGINRPLARIIDSLLAIDFSHTKKVNNGFLLLRHTLYGLQWIHNNRKEFKILEQITRQYGFPAEQLIGLPLNYEDSVSLAPFVERNGLGLELQDRRALFMLLHYYSFPGRDIDSLLYPEVLKGSLRPAHYARINDYRLKYGKYKHDTRLLYAVFASESGDETSKINDRRARLGLNTLEEQKRNDKINRQRMKAGTFNNEIILE